MILAIQNPTILDDYHISSDMFERTLFRSAIDQLGKFADDGITNINFRMMKQAMELPDLAADELKAIIEEAKDEFAVIGANEKNRDFYVNEFFEMTRQRMTDEVVNDYMLEKITREELAQRVSEIEMIGAIKKTSDSQWLDEAVELKTTQILQGKQDLLFALTGFRELDNLTKLATGTLNVLAARPSVGKTAFVLNLARNFSNIGGATTDFFSGETKTESLMNRIFAMETRIEARKYRELDLDEKEFERTMALSAEIAKRNMCITQMTNKNVYEIRKRVQQSKLERPAAIHVVLIDHLGLIKKHTKESRHDLDVGAITRYLKEMAIEEDIIIILLSQLSRNVEQREDKRPRLSDLRNSGDIEQDADDVWFLYRDDYYDKETENGNVIEVIVAKAREGQLGTAKLHFSKEIQRVVEIEYSRGGYSPPA